MSIQGLSGGVKCFDMEIFGWMPVFGMAACKLETTGRRLTAPSWLSRPPLPRCAECFKHGGESHAFNDVLTGVQNLPNVAKDVVRKVIDVRYRS